MHSIDHKVRRFGLWSVTLNYNPDWSGEVRVSWLTAEPPRDIWDAELPKWLEQHRRECTVNGRDLLRGQPEPLGEPDETVPREVHTIAVWLAVNDWWQSKILSFAEGSRSGES